MSTQNPQKKYVDPYQHRVDSSNQLNDSLMKFLSQNLASSMVVQPKESWSARHPFISTGLGALLGGLAGAYMGQSPTDTIIGLATGGLMGNSASSNARTKWVKDSNDYRKNLNEQIGKMVGYNKDYAETFNKNYDTQGDIDQGSIISGGLADRSLNIPRRIVGYNHDGSPVYGAPVVYNEASAKNIQDRMTAYDMQQMLQQNYGQAYGEYKTNQDTQYKKYAQPIHINQPQQQNNQNGVAPVNYTGVRNGVPIKSPSLLSAGVQQQQIYNQVPQSQDGILPYWNTGEIRNMYKDKVDIMTKGYTEGSKMGVDSYHKDVQSNQNQQKINEILRHNKVGEYNQTRNTDSQIGRRGVENQKTTLEMDKIKHPGKYAKPGKVKPEEMPNYGKALSQFMGAYNSGDQKKINIGRQKFMETFAIDPMTKIKINKKSSSKDLMRGMFEGAIK